MRRPPRISQTETAATPNGFVDTPTQSSPPLPSRDTIIESTPLRPALTPTRDSIINSAPHTPPLIPDTRNPFSPLPPLPGLGQPTASPVTDNCSEKDPTGAETCSGTAALASTTHTSSVEEEKDIFGSFEENPARQETLKSNCSRNSLPFSSRNNIMDNDNSTYGTAWGNETGNSAQNTFERSNSVDSNDTVPPLPPRNIPDTVYGNAWESQTSSANNVTSVLDNNENQPPLPPKSTTRPRPVSLPVGYMPTGSVAAAVPKNVTRQNSRKLAIVHGTAATEDSAMKESSLVVMSPGMKEPKDVASEEDDILPWLPPRRSIHERSPAPRTTPPPFTPYTPPSIGTPSEPAVEPWSPFPTTPGANATPVSESPFGAASLFPSPPITPASPTTNTSANQNFASSIVPPKMMEALGISDDDTVGGWHGPPPDTDAPPPYSPKNQLQRGANKSLKLSQVEVLKREMSHTGGVRVLLRKADCHHKLALVDSVGRVWVAGWNHPFLHQAFHLGDRVICINGQVVDGARMAQKLIKYCQTEDKITFIIQRVPFAKVFAIKRNAEGESLGIHRNGGTAEILKVDDRSLASEAGLSGQSLTADGANFCNWWLTEINNRPLNLFFKEKEIEHLLNAVGRDISFLVQPSSFIKDLKKQLKSLKNYKDYILQ